MYSIYIYKENNKEVYYCRANTLIEADAMFRQDNEGRDPGLLGLYIKQCPVELNSTMKEYKRTGKWRQRIAAMNI